MSQENQCNPAGFVDYVIKQVQDKNDTAFRAVMRRADNPNQCSAAWEYLVPFCDLSKDYQRLSFALVGAAIARKKPEKDGTQGLGAALRHICKDDADVNREARRLRRLLACNSALELIPVLRPIVQYIQSKDGTSIWYLQLLKDLLNWDSNPRERERTKIEWTRQYYHRQSIPAKTGEA